VLQNGETPLHKAAWNGHRDSFGVLINAGAKIDVIDKVS